MYLPKAIQLIGIYTYNQYKKIRLLYMNHYKNHIFFLVYQCLNTVPFQSLNYVHVYDIYKSEVYTYNSQVGLNKTATYEYHICIYKNYI